MNRIIVNNNVYRVHPVYTLYAASEDGQIIHVVKQKPLVGSP